MDELTYGGKIAGVDFNPSGDKQVAEAKAISANLIDLIAGPDGQKLSNSPLHSQLIDAAVFAVLEAQMMAVKAITFKY